MGTAWLRLDQSSAELSSSACLHHILPFQVPVDGHLSCCHLLIIEDEVALDTSGQIRLEFLFSIFWGLYLEVQWLDYTFISEDPQPFACFRQWL